MFDKSKKIAKKLIARLKELKLQEADGATLLRFSSGVDRPSTLTTDYRIQELKKFLRGEESAWAQTEIDAEKAFQEREAKRK